MMSSVTLGIGASVPVRNHDNVTSSWSEPRQRHIVVVVAAGQAMLE
jgi:hypothetical protein